MLIALRALGSLSGALYVIGDSLVGSKSKRTLNLRRACVLLLHTRPRTRGQVLPS
jgi:hypothetical protein